MEPHAHLQPDERKSTVALVARLARAIVRERNEEHLTRRDWDEATDQAVALIVKERRANRATHKNDYSAASAILATMPPEPDGPRPHFH